MTLCETEREPEVEPGEQPLDLPEGVPPLTTFYLYLTNGCNLACRHCWINPNFVDGEPDPGDCLDLELLKKAVREAKPLGLRSAKLTGGEPTLHPHFVEIVDYLTAEGLSLTMETNGTLIDEALARHLKEKTSLRHVSVSIDGPNAEVHNGFRGVKGSFEAAVQGLKNLVGAGFHPQLIMSPHRGNIQYVDEVVRMAVALEADSVKLNPIMRSGRGIEMHRRDEVLDFDEILAYAHYVRGELQQQTPIRLIWDTPPAFHTVSELVNNGSSGTCGIFNILGILGNGDIALCGIGTTIPDLCFGNLKSHNLSEIWFEQPKILKIRQMLSSSYNGICSQCIHSGRCLTHCVAQNYQDTGKLIAPAWLCAEAHKRGVFPTSRLKDSRSNVF